jgi:hypothetical protein
MGTDKLETLPDSRLKTLKESLRVGSTGNWQPIYCANCGHPGGRVPEENMTFAFWLCNNCYETHGAIAATMAVPDEIFWRELQEN